MPEGEILSESVVNRMFVAEVFSVDAPSVEMLTLE